MNKHISHYYQPSPRSLKRQYNWKGMGIKLFLSALGQLEWGWRGWIYLVGRKALLGNRCAIESSIPSFVPTFSGISCNWTRATDCFVGQSIRTFGTAYCPDFADEGRHFRCTSDNAIVHRGWFREHDTLMPLIPCRNLYLWELSLSWMKMTPSPSVWVKDCLLNPCNSPLDLMNRRLNLVTTILFQP